MKTSHENFHECLSFFLLSACRWSSSSASLSQSGPSPFIPVQSSSIWWRKYKSENRLQSTHSTTFAKEIPFAPSHNDIVGKKFPFLQFKETDRTKSSKSKCSSLNLPRHISLKHNQSTYQWSMRNLFLPTLQVGRSCLWLWKDFFLTASSSFRLLFSKDHQKKEEIGRDTWRLKTRKELFISPSPSFRRSLYKWIHKTRLSLR